jgi:uncharacterized protein (TIGR00297 family)
VSLWLLLGAGLVLNAVAAALVLWRGSVDRGGALAGIAVGTIIFGFGGPLFWVLLMAFFVSSTAASSLGSARKEQARKIHQKGSRRDAVQVLANGGVGAVCALVYRFTGNPSWALGFAVSLACSNADTWASELGELSRRDPVSLCTLRPVTPGLSGGVTLLGASMAFAGALFIALIFALENLPLRIVDTSYTEVALFVAAGGFLGATLDTVLGATLQAQYEPVEAPGSVTERRNAADGRRNRLVHGLSFVNNDLVNFASCAAVTAAAVLIAR